VHVSPRTLRRRLREEGTTFQALADDTLRELAEELLRGEAPIATVADRHGYADAVAFTRAFKRWTGEPPGAWSHRIRDTMSASFDTS
jgi:AraC-like DNA-binding protein